MSARWGRRLGCAALALLGPAALAHATPSSAEIVTALNGERALNWLPGTVIEDPAWSEGCRQHNEYVALHGLTHQQDPALAGATPAGADAARSSILATDSDWAEGNPWSSAPIHYMQMMAPQLARTGAAQSAGGNNCLWTWPGNTRTFATPGAYAIPGVGRIEVPPQQTAAEQPFVPGDFVGLPQGTTTGPHLYWLAAGPTGENPHGDWSRVRLVRAELVGPSGPVELRSVDNHTDQIGAMLPPGAISIPTRPLQANAEYRGHAVLAEPSGRTVEVSTTFTTAALPNRILLRTDRRTVQGLRLHLTGDAPAAHVTVTTGSRTLTRRITTGRWHGLPNLPAGTNRICVRSGGEGTEYQEASRCISVRTAVRPPVTLHRSGTRVVLTARTPYLGAFALVRYHGTERSTRIRLSSRSTRVLPTGTRRVCIIIPSVVRAGVTYDGRRPLCTPTFPAARR